MKSFRPSFFWPRRYYSRNEDRCQHLRMFKRYAFTPRLLRRTWSSFRFSNNDICHSTFACFLWKLLPSVVTKRFSLLYVRHATKTTTTIMPLARSPFFRRKIKTECVRSTDESLQRGCTLCKEIDYIQLRDWNKPIIQFLSDVIDSRRMKSQRDWTLCKVIDHINSERMEQTYYAVKICEREQRARLAYCASSKSWHHNK